jgi:hypothetical protein
VKLPSEFIIVLIHIVLILVYAVFILLGRSHLRKEHIVPLCLIPVVGILVAWTIEFMMVSDKQGHKRPDMERLALDDDILWATLRSSTENRDLVPLEEAVLINEVKVRRRSMLETLYADPFKYLDVLNVAKYNEDIETSHYATTTISKAQKDFQLAIQKRAAQVEHHPDDLAALEAYLDILQKYIHSGLLEEHLLRNLRIVYSKALDKKLAVAADDKYALIEKLRNAVELKDYASAFDTSRLLKTYWPEDEQTWVEALRVCIEGNDRLELKELIEEIERTEIVWTEQGREQISPWITTAAK